MPYDIAVNITDSQYSGSGKRPGDIPAVVHRAKQRGIQQVFLGVSYRSSLESVALAREFGELATVGIHPLSAEQCTEDEIIGVQQLARSGNLAGGEELIRPEIKDLLSEKTAQPRGELIGIGEVGLDYYRGAAFKDRQKAVFRAMLDLSAAEETREYPFIFHYRDCGRDFLEVVDDYAVRGVVHSFTNTPEEMQALVKKGYYIGINGISIKESQLTAVIEEIPLDRLLLETDAPYCGIKKTSPYFSATTEYLPASKAWSLDSGVRGRNEPINLLQVIDIVAAIRCLSPAELIAITDRNFERLFGSGVNK